MRPVIILFAKAPVPGAVKTRLHSVLSPLEAARFHEACVRDVLGRLAPLRDAADLELHTNIPTDAWSEENVAYGLQADGDLGRRMWIALQGGLAQGRPAVMIVGSDAPTLPESHLRDLLARAGDVAFGPARDGGYYAISCRRSHPEMFKDVEWSSRDTLAQTIRACRACGLRVEIGPEWYDIDTPEDLVKLGAEKDLPAHVARWLASKPK